VICRTNARPNSSASDDARDSPSGAGAAPGGQNRQPRAGSGRGKQDKRSAQFYAHLKQKPSITRPGIAWRGMDRAAASRIIAHGEFRGLARWSTSAFPVRASLPPAQEGLSVGANDQNLDSREGDDGLAACLSSIADEVYRHATAARDGVLADFAARVAHARKHLSPHLLAATLAAIKEQRKAALTLISRNAASELAARKKAASETFGNKRSPERKQRYRPHGAAPTRPPNL